MCLGRQALDDVMLNRSSVSHAQLMSIIVHGDLSKDSRQERSGYHTCSAENKSS
ncbi:hypothetical protein C2845_PM07G10410 [Panicum miliaceum]|uniref:Uncharacterized protein n=1 Tax=Panicum miliaceum TaxID=4540 RepID=A0A3L6SU58_PANMI|nr:hypothetical protein C2845_PM07G10410 [Panicum miliaceum]